MKVLIVDDSVVFRSQIKAALSASPGIEVVGTANNGKIALQKLAQNPVDLITLDMEMPEMGGIETIKAIRALKIPVKILVFSSHTVRGSDLTMEALSKGADDFVAKPQGTEISFESAAEKIKSELVPKILQFKYGEKVFPKSVVKTPSVEASQSISIKFTKKSIFTFRPKVVVIGSSTGGPPALEKILSKLPRPMKTPIFITQHMPPIFTAALSKRLTEITGVLTAEGGHNEIVKPDRIYVAPGNFHMTLVKNGADIVIQLDQSTPRNSVRPAVDPMFESAVGIFGEKTLGIILTGMGEDGLTGCRTIKQAGGGVVIQNKETCVVFGMPGAVHNEHLQDEEMNLEQINELVKRVVQ